MSRELMRGRGFTHGLFVCSLMVVLFISVAMATGTAAAQTANVQPQGRSGPSTGFTQPSPEGLKPSIRLTPIDLARLKGEVARADSLANAHRTPEAEELYWAVIAEQRAGGEYPGETLRQLAKLYFAAGSSYAAANLLSELAESAGTFGDPPAQLRALFEAALLYQAVHRDDRVAQCLDRLMPLLQSPAIPDSIRREIASKVPRR